jgi:DNA polymerase IV (DinB-like DNA polymerase)
MAERGATLPGTAAETPDRVLLHVDVDCFYAACERLRDPSLAGEPVVVGMGYEEGADAGAVATASYEARAYGVESAQAISTALERLPRRATAADETDTGVYRPVDMEYYESVAADVKAVLRDLGDTVREVSIDEAYLDVSGSTDWDVAAGFARHVKQRIRREVGVVASVGAAPTMSAAKIASDHDKPDGLVVVPPDDLQSFLADLDVGDLHGVGPVTERALRERGLETIGGVAAADPDALEDRFGEQGRALWRRARGVDDRAVEPRGRPKSLSRESSLPEATTDAATMRERVTTLADAVAERASRKGALYRTIGIKVVTTPYDVNTRAHSLSGPVDDPSLVRSVALDLLEEFADREVRKLGVRVSNLDFADADQASLEGWGEGTANPTWPERRAGQTRLSDFQ